MLIIHKDKDERNGSWGTNSVSTILCVGRVSRHLEGEHVGRSGRRIIRIWDSERILGKYKEIIWRKRQGVSKGSIIEEIRTRREDNRGVHTGYYDMYED